MSKETDVQCRRTALFSLSRISLVKALDYFKRIAAQADSLEEPVQQALVDFMRLYGSCEYQQEMTAFFVQVTIAILVSLNTSNAILFECATLLPILSPSQSEHVKIAADCLIRLVGRESDNNVRLILLDHVRELYKNHSNSLQSCLIDLVTILTSRYTCDVVVLLLFVPLTIDHVVSSSPEIRKQCLSIVTEYVRTSHLPELVECLRKELEKTLDETEEQVMVVYDGCTCVTSPSFLV